MSKAGPIQESADATKKAAQETKVAAQSTLSSAEQALQISADQLVFAAERTYAAWVRTGLVSLASGIGAKKLLGGLVPEWMAIAAGAILVLFSAFCFVAGIWRHLRPGLRAPLKANVPQMPTAILMIVSGFLAIVALVALVSVVVA